MTRNRRETCIRFLTALGIGACYIWLLFRPADASAAAVSSLRLCAGVIVPSLFPFFVCTNLFSRLHLTKAAERVFSRFMRPLFSLPGSCAAALVAGFTGGYPSGAQAVAALYEDAAIDKEQASRLLALCNNCGPAFIFGVVAPLVFRRSLAGLLLYLVHCLSALLPGLIVRRKKPCEPSAPHAPACSCVSFSEAFTASVRRSGKTALEICMFVLVFGILGAMAQTALSPLLPAWTLTLVSGAFELSGGASALSKLSAPLGMKFVLASFFLAFGGASVHAQTKAVLGAAGLYDLPVFLPKLRHALFAALLSVPVYILFRKPLSAAAAFSGGVSFLFPIAAEFFLCAALIFLFRKMAGSNFSGHRV